MLTAARTRQAERLQQQGLLLREIAGELGVGYVDVVLALYGAVPSAMARRSAKVPEAPKPLPAGHGHSATEPFTPEQQPAEAKTSGEEPLSSGSGGVQDRCESTPPPIPTPADGGAPVAAPVVSDSGLGLGSEVAISTAARKDVHRSSSADGSTDSRSNAEEPIVAVAHPQGTARPDEGAGTQAPPVETSLPPFASSLRYRLRAGDGAYLHEHERGLTRLPSFFWRGSAADFADLKRRRPEWAALTPEEIRT